MRCGSRAVSHRLVAGGEVEVHLRVVRVERERAIEVRDRVTAPLERQFGQIPGLKQLSSTSSGGIIPSGSNWETICSYLTRTSSLVSYHFSSSFHGSIRSLYAASTATSAPSDSCPLITK